MSTAPRKTDAQARHRGGKSDASTADERRASLAARVKMARQMAGLSQGQVARLMKLHRPTISEAEAGRRRISADELAGFAKLYGVSVEWLSGAAPESVDPKDSRVELAARELAKLQPQDLNRVLQLLAALRTPGDHSP